MSPVACGACIKSTCSVLDIEADESEVAGIANQVAHERTLAFSGKSRHPMLHVGEEALARLLAVVADVDAAFELARDDAAG